MKKIIALIVVFMMLAMVLTSCDTSLNEVTDSDDLKKEEDAGDGTQDTENNTDNDADNDADGEASDKNNDSDKNDDSDGNNNSGENNGSDDTSDGDKDTNDSEDSSQGGSLNDFSAYDVPETIWDLPAVELQEPITVGDYQLALNVEGTEYTVVKYSGEAKDLEVISEHEGIPVTRIGERAFENCYGLESVIIPSGFTTIGSDAFNYCFTITSIEIPESVVFIGKDAMHDCWDIESITVKEGNPRYNTSGNCLIETASNAVIKGTNNSMIPDGITAIADYAFYGMDSLKEIVIPDTVKSIGERSFYACSSIDSIIVEEGNPRYHSSGNCLIETATKTLIQGSNNAVIPTDGSVEYMDALAFSSCEGLKSIHIPAAIKRLSEHSFSDCTGLESITVEEGHPNYYSIGNCIIEKATKTLVLGCKTSVIPGDGSVTVIGKFAFSGQSVLDALVIPEGITIIDNNAFHACDGGNELAEVVLPDGLLEIRTGAFNGAGMASITIPNSVEYIGEAAVSAYQLKIYFKGTEEEWNAIEKHERWNYNHYGNTEIIFNQ